MCRSTAQHAAECLAQLAEAIARFAHAVADSAGNEAAWHEQLSERLRTVASECVALAQDPESAQLWSVTASDVQPSAAPPSHASPEVGEHEGEPSSAADDVELDERASHIAGADVIRSDVAAFRQRLREEQAERARQAADERRRFVERLRGGDGEAKSDGPPGKPSTDASERRVTAADDQVADPVGDGAPGIRFRQRQLDDLGGDLRTA